MDYQQKNEFQYQNPYTATTVSPERQTLNPHCPPPGPTMPYGPSGGQPNFGGGQQTYPQAPTPYSQNVYSSPYGPMSGVVEESYIENILRLNKGKVGTFYFTYTDSNEWRDRVYKGVIEAAGRDHLIISDPKTGKRLLLLMIYFNYAEFDEEIAYDYPFR